MKLAVAIDGSEHDQHAIDFALRLNSCFTDVQLEIIHVIDFDKVDERLLKESPKSLALYQEQKVHPVLKRLEKEGIEAKLTMLRGNPGPQIVKHVNLEQMDHLVLGSRSLTPLKEIIFGSVGQKVLKHVKCSVTIIK